MFKRFVLLTFLLIVSVYVASCGNSSSVPASPLESDLHLWHDRVCLTNNPDVVDCSRLNELWEEEHSILELGSDYTGVYFLFLQDEHYQKLMTQCQTALSCHTALSRGEHIIYLNNDELALTSMEQQQDVLYYMTAYALVVSRFNPNSGYFKGCMEVDQSDLSAEVRATADYLKAKYSDIFSAVREPVYTALLAAALERSYYVVDPDIYQADTEVLGSNCLENEEYGLQIGECLPSEHGWQVRFVDVRKYGDFFVPVFQVDRATTLSKDGNYLPVESNWHANVRAFPLTLSLQNLGIIEIWRFNWIGDDNLELLYAN